MNVAAWLLPLQLIFSTLEAQQHTVYLIGDAGKDTLPGPALQLLSEMLQQDHLPATVLFLGDNVYPKGLEKPGSRNRAVSEKKLLTQLHVADQFRGHFIMIPGNHDWRASRWAGLRQLADQEQFVRAHFAKEQSTIQNPSSCFLPSGGLPGPEIVQLDTILNIRLIVYDPQWWLHQQFFHQVARNPGMKKKEMKKQFFKQLKQDIETALIDSSTVIIAGHHPLMTAGEHARLPQPLHFVTTYIPPFQLARPLGLNRLYRQDIQSNAYRKLADSMLSVIQSRQSLIYANGHDHNLQFFADKNQNVFITSGAGSSTTSFDPKAQFIPEWKDDKHSGFFKLIFDESGLLQVYVCNAQYPEGKKISSRMP